MFIFKNNIVGIYIVVKYALSGIFSGTVLHLNHGFVSGEIGSSLLPGLDDTEQTKFLDEHDLNEVLNKLPEEAFDIFTGLTNGTSPS